MRLGSSNLEIGHRLGIAERTVKAHVTAMLAKLNAPDRAGAVARGFDLGLLQVDPGVAEPRGR
jgi:DNA-binding NarL/FixJ family response regulator